jgi:hypothetical protein
MAATALEQSNVRCKRPPNLSRAISGLMLTLAHRAVCEESRNARHGIKCAASSAVLTVRTPMTATYTARMPAAA